MSEERLLQEERLMQLLLEEIGKNHDSKLVETVLNFLVRHQKIADSDELLSAFKRYVLKSNVYILRDCLSWAFTSNHIQLYKVFQYWIKLKEAEIQDDLATLGNFVSEQLFFPCSLLFDKTSKAIIYKIFAKVTRDFYLGYSYADRISGVKRVFAIDKAQKKLIDRNPSRYYYRVIFEVNGNSVVSLLTNEQVTIQWNNASILELFSDLKNKFDVPIYLAPKNDYSIRTHPILRNLIFVDASFE